MMLFSLETKEALAKTLPEYSFCFCDVLPSTQDECLRMYQKEPDKKWVVLAKEQTQGRGRYSRVWQSPPGVNLYVSFIDDNSFGKQIGYLNLFYGILLFEAVSSVLGFSDGLTLKWPNDLYFKDKKLAGILFQSLEMEMQKLIVGIGINVYAQKEQIPETGTSLLLEAGQNLSPKTRVSLLEKLFLSLNTEHRAEYSRNPSLVLDRFWEYSRATQQNQYLYSSHFYSHTGVLDKIHSDGTVDILTQDAQRIHLKT